MRAFLTGASGFVGGHLRAHLSACGDEVVALGDQVDLGAPDASEQLVAALSGARPNVVYHLAALTHVGRSWEQPRQTTEVNVLGTLAVLEACWRQQPSPRVLLVSSAEVYGAAGPDRLAEDAPLRPVTPYAASKVAAEYLGLQAYLGRGLEVVRARPFNHVGPGQGDAFVVAALARRVALAERDGDGEIAVGNLTAARDFTDVRDVVRAYRLLAELGVPGEAYNVCSGRARTIAELLEVLLSRARRPIRAREDPALLRPVDVPLLVGDASKLAALTAWRPEIPLEQTLGDVLEAWRASLAEEHVA